MRRPSALSARTNSPWWAWGLLLGWLLAALAFLWQQNQPYYGTFDPHQQLAALPTQLPAEIAEKLPPQQGEQLLAVLDDRCYCSLNARRHLSELSQQSGKHIEAWTVAQLQQVGLRLPATPALLWWRQGKLWYVGPLAGGAVCSSNNDLLLPLLRGTQHLPDSWRNGETAACRCLS